MFSTYQKDSWFDNCNSDSDFKKMIQVKEKCLEISIFIIEYHMTIRSCANEVGMSKSTVHAWIHRYISIYDDERYQQIMHQLRYNKKYCFCNRKQQRLKGLI